MSPPVTDTVAWVRSWNQRVAADGRFAPIDPPHLDAARGLSLEGPWFDNVFAARANPWASHLDVAHFGHCDPDRLVHRYALDGLRYTVFEDASYLDVEVEAPGAQTGTEAFARTVAESLLAQPRPLHFSSPDRFSTAADGPLGGLAPGVVGGGLTPRGAYFVAEKADSNPLLPRPRPRAEWLLGPLRSAIQSSR